MVISGLDLSTSVAGYCNMSEDGELLHWDYYKFSKPDDYDLIDLVEQFNENVWPHLQDSDLVVLEDALKKYGGMTTRKSITVLLKFNGIIEYELQRKLGKDSVTKIHPSTAKKQALGRGRTPSGYESPWSTYKDSKAWAIERVDEMYDEVEWEMTRSGNPRPGSDDVADAIVLAKGQADAA